VRNIEMVKLWRCKICGDAYIGAAAPTNCPFCGAKGKFIFKIQDVEVNFDVPLTETDKKNVEHALDVEVSNAEFYFCAAKKTPGIEAQKLFKTLGKVEAEHASIWKKILKLGKVPEGKEECSEEYTKNLEDSHAIEAKAIEFYKKAAEEADNERIKEIFEALVDVELDHLKLSEERLK
tara:strand:- start:7914 stop:8447 length:534 start_codon:yes stop_codon:yes gene_type:complete